MAAVTVVRPAGASISKSLAVSLRFMLIVSRRPCRPVDLRHGEKILSVLGRQLAVGEDLLDGDVLHRAEKDDVRIATRRDGADERVLVGVAGRIVAGHRVGRLRGAPRWIASFTCAFIVPDLSVSATLRSSVTNETFDQSFSPFCRNRGTALSMFSSRSSRNTPRCILSHASWAIRVSWSLERPAAAKALIRSMSHRPAPCPSMTPRVSRAPWISSQILW